MISGRTQLGLGSLGLVVGPVLDAIGVALIGGIAGASAFLVSAVALIADGLRVGP